jgi:hypothetical protein
MTAAQFAGTIPPIAASHAPAAMAMVVHHAVLFHLSLITAPSLE